LKEKHGRKIGGENMAMTLKAARINAGLNQQKAAKMLGINVSTLSNYERAKSFPDVPTIKKIEKVYGVTYDDIIFLPKNYD
jgi:putative transcriptional regulator